MVEGQDARPARGEDFAQAWQDMRAEEDIQFAPVEMPEQPDPPDWLQNFMKWLSEALSPVGEALVEVWPVLKWVLVGLLAAAILYGLIRAFGPDLLRKRSARPAADEWTPDTTEALALLEEADRLAAEGQYDEATHLLLKRSVGQIAAARPDLVDPSSTARELSAEQRLPDGARTAFTVIAERVERSLFALVSLSQEDWQAARSAYADFALAHKALAA